jgi:hypothetical protein
MSAMVGTLILMQAWAVTPAQPMVGDTVTIERDVAVADPAARLRLVPIESSELIEPLTTPEAAGGTGGFVARYVVALFESGDHAIAMPDLELVYPDGRVETRVGGAALVTVVSVLPAEDSLPPPRPSREPIPTNALRVNPAIFLVAGVLMLSLGWGVVRRRSQERPSWAVSSQAGDDVPVLRWIAAGEPRAVATVTMHGMRERIRQYVPEAEPSLDLENWLRTVEAQRPLWPLRELSEIMRALERASYAPAIPSDVIALADEAQVLGQAVESAEAAAADAEDDEEE